MQQPISVSYKSTNNVYVANQYLREISAYSIFAADFEVALKYTDADIASFRAELDAGPAKRRRIELEAKLAASALDHVSHTRLTHLSIATSESEAYVFIIDNPKLQARLLNFLVTTTQRQVWHNASFDFRHLYHYTGRFPILYEDTQIFAKTILNHVDVQQATTGLKELAGKWYGAWGISADNFSVAQMYEPHVLLYAATDACATLKLWYSINQYVESAASSTL